MTHVLTVTLNAAIDVTLALPHFEVGGAHTAREVVKLPGGKGVNVARSTASASPSSRPASSAAPAGTLS